MKLNQYLLQSAFFIVLVSVTNVYAYGQRAFRTQTDTVLERSLNIPSDIENHLIDMVDVDECIALFKSDMQKHQIWEIETGLRQIAKATLIAPRMITTSELFGGKKLHEWMTSTIYTLDSAELGNNVGFQLMFGVYTQKFLDKYVKDATDKANRKDRITIFIVPIEKATGNRLYRASDRVSKNVLQQTVSAKNATVTAYELGGLQP